MSKLDLNNYTEREIVSALLNLPIDKFVATMGSVAATITRAQDRGKEIASDDSNSANEKLLRRLFEGEQGPTE